MTASIGPILFIDRDGTLVEEPPDEQVDRSTRCASCRACSPRWPSSCAAGYRLVMVTNQDGLGTDAFPRAAFEQAHAFILGALRSQGVEFDAVFVCPHLQRRRLRLPQARAPGCCASNPARAAWISPRSAVIGDRDTDLELAAQPRRPRPARAASTAAPAETWPAVVAEADRAARPASSASPARPRIDVARGSRQLPLRSASPPASASSITCSSSSPSTAASRSSSPAGATCAVDEHHTVEDCALALGEALRQALGAKARDRPLRLPAADGRGRRRRWPSICPGGPSRSSRGPLQPRGGRRPADRAGAAFLPLAGGSARRRGAHQRHGREHPPHDRGAASRASAGRCARRCGARASELPSTKGVL